MSVNLGQDTETPNKTTIQLRDSLVRGEDNSVDKAMLSVIISGIVNQHIKDSENFIIIKTINGEFI